MSRLPIPGSDDNVWGSILNDFLGVAHNADGTLKGSALTQAGGYIKPAGGIPSTDLTAAVQASLNNADSAVQIGGDLGGTPSAPTIAQLQGTSLQVAGPSDAQVLTYNATSNQWLPATVSSVAVSDATSSSKGIVQLAGDLGGIAAAPTVIHTSLANPLPISQGGTSSITQNFVDLTGTQTVGGNKTFSGTTVTTSLDTTNLQVTGGTPGSGKVLTSDASGNATWATVTAGSSALGSDTDVTLSGLGDGQVLTYNASATKWENKPPTVSSVAGMTGTVTLTTSNLGDVTVTSVSDGQVLTYSQASGKWKNQTPSSAAGATSSSLGLLQLSGDLSGTATAPTVTSTSLTTPLGVNQGGIGVGNITGVLKGNGTSPVTGSATLNDVATPTASFSMGGFGLTSVANPSNPSDAATKNYVDTTAQGLTVLSPVQAATAGSDLGATYNSGAGTLTESGNGALVVDGYTAQVGDRILVKDETAQADNGIYVVTTTGNVGAAYVLTRSSDFNTSGNKYTGSYVFVNNGTVNTHGSYLCTTPGIVTFGTTVITWTLFSSASQVTAGTGLTQTGNTLSLNAPVSVANGGTGQNSQQAALNALTGTQVAGTYVRSDGTNATLSTIQAADLPGASATNKGVVKLAGDLNGSGSTSALPKVNFANDTLHVPLAGGTMTGSLTVPSFQVTGGTPTVGYVLTSDASGNATWQASGSSFSGSSAGGDLSGTYPSPSVAKVNGVTISGSPSANQALLASSGSAAAWGSITNANISNGAAIAVSKISGLGTAATLNAGAANGVAGLDTNSQLKSNGVPLILTKYSQTWTIGGYVNVAQGDIDYINPIFVSAPSWQTLQVVAYRCVIHSGTNANVDVQRNGVSMTGFSSITVTTTANSATPTAVTLSDGDMLQLVVNSISNSPMNLSFSIVLQVSV